MAALAPASDGFSSMTVRHVRVLTALVAAITLHALLLSWSLPESKSMLINNGLLHIDLLEVAKPTVARQAPASPSINVTHAQPKLQQISVHPRQPNQSHQKQKSSVIHSLASAQQPIPRPAPAHLVHASVKTLLSTAHQETLKPHHLSRVDSIDSMQRADHLSTSHGESAQPHQPSPMAVGAQSMLLANIHYPPQARRHGWQGVGEFQLAIVSQSIRNITMLASTGHDILDRAARRGLISVSTIPVPDGLYRLPVEFRLQ